MVEGHVPRPDPPTIDTAPFEYPGTGTVVAYVYPELSALCPKTGLPDLYRLDLTFQPDSRLPELRSFKMYLLSFRNAGIWHEHLANRILGDFVEAVAPRWARIVLRAANRGGIFTTVARYWTPEGDLVPEALRALSGDEEDGAGPIAAPFRREAP